jgi:hypothetical protein
MCSCIYASFSDENAIAAPEGGPQGPDVAVSGAEEAES